MIIFCDGSIVGNSLGLGVVVCRADEKTNKVKELVYVHKKIIHNISDVHRQHYEFLAILEALEVLRLFEPQKTTIFNDCAGTVELLERLVEKSRKNFKHKEFYLKNITISPEVRFQWDSRKNKGIYIADKLSKPYYPYFGEEFIFEKLESWVNELKKMCWCEQTFEESVTSHKLSQKNVISVI